MVWFKASLLSLCNSNRKLIFFTTVLLCNIKLFRNAASYVQERHRFFFASLRRASSIVSSLALFAASLACISRIAALIISLVDSICCKSDAFLLSSFTASTAKAFKNHHFHCCRRCQHPPFVLSSLFLEQDALTGLPKTPENFLYLFESGFVANRFWAILGSLFLPPQLVIASQTPSFNAIFSSAASFKSAVSAFAFSSSRQISSNRASISVRESISGNALQLTFSSLPKPTYF